MNNLPPYVSIKYFKGLNSLRFIAAALVVVSHAESIRKKYGTESMESFGFFRNGGNAVSFFFVLSGFLITYLLLKEQRQTDTISVENFYLNRILRIWPLYFLLVVIGVFVLPTLAALVGYEYNLPYEFNQVWYFFLFFVPGLVTFFYGHHFLEPLWSIGVEEVFYVFWAPVFKLVRNKLPLILYGIIALKLVLLTLGQLYQFDDLFIYLLSTFQFEAMAIGGLGAYYLFRREMPISDLRIFRKEFQIIIYSLLLGYLLVHPYITEALEPISIVTTPLIPIILDATYLYLIIGTSLVSANVFKLENKAMRFLGEISYGIYMYQLVAISITIVILKNLIQNTSFIAGTVIFYFVLFSILIGIAYLSKRLFEDLFLRFKKRTYK